MIEPVSPYLNQQGEGKNNKKAIMVGAVIVIAILIGAFLMLRQSKETEETKVAVSVTTAPSPTEKPKIDKKTVKIQVLNGTGTPGQAGTAVKALEDAGYDPDNIKTANAEEFDNTVTTIAAREGFEDTASDISNTLKTVFDKIRIESTQLDADNEFDIVVTTGGKIFEEATPTAAKDLTPSPTSGSTDTTPTPTSTPTLTPTPTT